MSLEEKLAAIREMAKSHQSAEVRAVMQRAIDDLRASGIMDRVARVGAPAPDFTLPNADRPAGESGRASGARAGRALVLPRPLVTLLQRRAVCSAAGVARDHRRRRLAGGHVAAGRAHRRARRRSRQPLTTRSCAISAIASPSSTGSSSRCPRRSRRSTRSFGIDLANGNGDGTWRLPIPARFVSTARASSAPSTPIPTTHGVRSPRRRWRRFAASRPGEGARSRRVCPRSLSPASRAARGRSTAVDRVPEGLDPSVKTREITFEADVTSVTPFRRSRPRTATARGT